jgi:hypothetical protein
MDYFTKEYAFPSGDPDQPEEITIVTDGMGKDRSEFVDTEWPGDSTGFAEQNVTQQARRWADVCVATERSGRIAMQIFAVRKDTNGRVDDVIDTVYEGQIPSIEAREITAILIGMRTALGRDASLHNALIKIAGRTR